MLHLDKNFNPFPNSAQMEFESFTFSGGEPHIKIKSTIEPETRVTITHRIQSFNDLGLLMIAADAVKRMGVENIELFIPYFPAARQDRVMILGESLSVKVYADIINQIGARKLTIYDAHSEVAPALLDNCNAISNHGFIKKVLSKLPTDTILISPDGGALKKIYKLAAHLKSHEVVECGKTRNLETGALSGFKVYADDLAGTPCLIVDDICDGGGTFLGLAQELKKNNAGDLFLAVSHGIFNKGFEKLNNEFAHVYSTNAFKSIESTDKFTQIELSNEII